LEPEVVRLAAQGLPEQTRELLLRLTEEMEHAARQGDRQAWYIADIKWHETLSNCCPNHLLGQLDMQARSRMHNVGAEEHVADQYLIDGTLEHKQVLDAILTGEGEVAERLMREHIRLVRENMFRRLVRI
jgi:DNA-binding FadR family transcriptional regulator